MSCPQNSFKGVQTLTGPLTLSILQSIQASTAPFILDIAPRGIRPNVEKNHFIEDTMGNSIEIDGVKYKLLSLVYIYQPIHTGYTLPSQPTNQIPTAELVIWGFSQTSGAQKRVLICFPIYVSTNTSAYSQYLDQIWNPDAPVANLQTLFLSSASDTNQVSLNYIICKDTQISTYIFPRGITIPSANWQSFLNIYGNLATFDYGNAGMLSSALLTVTSDEFTNHFVYYTKPPSLRGRFDGSVCPAYKTTEYKCVPFDRIKDLQGDTVVMDGANTLADRLAAQDQAQSDAINSVGGPDSGAEAGIIAAAVAGSVLGALLLIFISSKIATLID